MAFIFLDIEDKAKLGRVARGCGLTVEALGWGFIELHEELFRARTNVVSVHLLPLCFGSDVSRDTLVEAMTSVGLFRDGENGELLAPSAAKYLKIKPSGRVAVGSLEGSGRVAVGSQVDPLEGSGRVAVGSVSKLVSSKLENTTAKKAAPWTEDERATKAAVLAAHLELRSGLPLEFRNHIDAKPFRQKLKTYGAEVFLRCWRYALASQDPYLRASSVAELCGTKWPRILDAASKDAPKPGEVYS